MTERTRVLIADDHVHAREAIREILSAYGTYDIVSEASNGEEAVAATIALQPELVLMDINMPSVDGFEATRQIKRQSPETKIIMLTVSEDSTHLFQALKEGAQGYLLKNIGLTEWDRYIQAVLDDDTPFSKQLIQETLQSLVSSKETKPNPLSTREQQVLELVVAGASNRVISEQLYISEHTVKNHIKSLLRKLNVHNRVELVRVAYKNGWIT
ncbi:chemotaxis protein CheY [Pontibacillus halophilus JSM 076056 = DSM 19796]|uniref:Chemotaxis protein CheY n=1 Tax=Pontibacillus halophilus JSM 076056 = DSM 19796 TaxID=1385510 RepID=A0A0A5GHI8_9BACI|nr:response regulator transcription factor [Pontibacillus halophilus]KGX90555.1 chemotaxis protein CheY [Pontibacillus halophilus JSM 076056 = DSM 19796]